jgi:hypothetical protein
MQPVVIQDSPNEVLIFCAGKTSIPLEGSAPSAPSLRRLRPLRRFWKHGGNPIRLAPKPLLFIFRRLV